MSARLRASMIASPIKQKKHNLSNDNKHEMKSSQFYIFTHCLKQFLLII